MSRQLTDAHVHLWDVQRKHYAWLEEFPTLNKTHTLSDFTRAVGKNDVDRIVFVECAGADDAATSRDEVEWVMALASRDERIAGIVAHAPLEKGTDVASHLEWLRDQRLVRGVRRLLQGESDPQFCLRTEFVEGVQLLATLDLAFDACIYHHQMYGLIRLVEQCPNVRFILDHLGKPSIRTGEMDAWREHIQALASFQHVSCKLSGALTEAHGEAWTEADIRPYLEVGIDAFGGDRILYGGDWPVLNLAGTYAQWIELVRRTLDGFSDIPPEKLFSENAARVYRLDD